MVVGIDNSHKGQFYVIMTGHMELIISGVDLFHKMSTPKKKKKKIQWKSYKILK